MGGSEPTIEMENTVGGELVVGVGENLSENRRIA